MTSRGEEPRNVPLSLRAVQLLAALLVVASLLLLTRSAGSSGVNLTRNWGFEEGFRPNGVGLEWQPFVLAGNVTFANTIEYFWPGAEHTEGDTSQLIISKTAFAAGAHGVMTMPARFTALDAERSAITSRAISPRGALSTRPT